MILIRFRHAETIETGIVHDGKVYLAEAGASGTYVHGRVVADLDSVDLLAPCQPSKVIAVGLNYQDPAQEGQSSLPRDPIISLKPPSAVIGPGDQIAIPRSSTRVDFEGELAVVIGRTTKDVEAADAASYILGYTCGNDVTARDVQRREGQWAKAKGFDTFCPLGPWIVTDVDPFPRSLVVRVNGAIRQSSSTEMMHFRPYELVSYVSKVMTLVPGDVILTGTPPGFGPIVSGDIVEVEIDGIGTLRNPVIQAQN
jgi:2-keto-4-pentenoate hydratase/2-oxohepta-3-ene-1,7-dioic acid hydratase in catechol pathway